MAFLKGDVDTALLRLRSYVRNYKNEQNYHNALFKIATIHYSRQEFDSAGYYYGLASKDNRLQRDALRNQIICYKKSQNWQRAINAAWDILPLISIEEEAEIRFELGYAYLRDGKGGEAIKHLKRAVESVSTPEHLYWLAEAYLSKADFIRSLYQYQKIVHQFPHDEMWTPTAQYKSGIVLEFMDQFDESKKIYKQLINTRGLGDTWGAEAQKRLEKME
ncbi:MAG: tetratricopeptide repeat protein [candidate division WOR-3 bacterium]|nr:MAG: tetratricopeptide repeat protein [candidate division WOR-3 bacterium]